MSVDTLIRVLGREFHRTGKVAKRTVAGGNHAVLWNFKLFFHERNGESERVTIIN